MTATAAMIATVRRYVADKGGVETDDARGRRR